MKFYIYDPNIFEEELREHKNKFGGFNYESIYN